MSDEWPVTLWYSTLGVGDGHDHATRGYLDALLAAGYEGIRLPPSQASSLLMLDTEVEPDLARFRPLLQPPRALGMKSLKRIEEGDPRIGQPRKYHGSLAGDPVHNIAPVDPKDNVVAVGDVDLEAYQIETDEHGGAFTTDEAFASDTPMRVQAMVMHHDPGSIVKHYTGVVRMGRPEDVAMVGVTVWEPDRIRAAVVQILSELDLVVVPSEHSKRALVTSGLDTRCEVVPHAFDPETWPRPEARAPTDPFVFYSIAPPIARKNLRGLLTAYFRAFDADCYQGKVILCLKTSGQRDVIRSLVEEAQADAWWMNPAGHRYARLKVFTKRLSAERLQQLHRAGDCYVSATRGEGFGLTEAEAVLSGNRVITTGWGAATEILRGSGHLWVPYTMANVPTEMAEFGPYAENQQWADPDLDALVVEMRKAFDERQGRDPAQWDSLMPVLRTDVIGRDLSALIQKAREEALEEDW